MGHVEVSKDAIESLARWYAREAGVRNLAKLVDKVTFGLDRSQDPSGVACL